MDTFSEVIVAAASGAIASGLVVWLIKEWIGVRLKSGIQHEYDVKLEKHRTLLRAEQERAILDIKTAMARDAAFNATAHASFAEGQKASMERKLTAIDTLWAAVLRARASAPPVLHFIDLLHVDEYRDEGRKHPAFRELTEGLSEKTITAAMVSDVEGIRPYVGEYLWALFGSYQAIFLRAAFLLAMGRDDPAKMEWQKDSGIKSLLQAVLSATELQEFERTRFAKITWLRRVIEGKILAAMAQVISGEKFGEESLERARAMQHQISSMSEAATQSAVRRRPT
jgi:hypothetical protein